MKAGSAGFAGEECGPVAKLGQSAIGLRPAGVRYATFPLLPASKDPTLHRSRAIMALAMIVANVCSVARAIASPSTSLVAMQKARWIVTGDAQFTSDPRIADGIMTITKGSARLKRVQFSTGTIEFDTKLEGGGITGIRFRQSRTKTADVFYLRPSDDCATSFECIQYMPLHHGSYEWNLIPNMKRAHRSGLADGIMYGSPSRVTK